MTKAQHIKWFGLVTLVKYILLSYVAVHRLGWLEGLAAVAAFGMVVGAIRTKTSWDEIVESDHSGRPAE